MAITVPTTNGSAIDLEQVTIFLGANGSGKSSLLKGLKDELRKTNPNVLYVEGGRVIQLTDNIGRMGPMMGDDTLEAAETQYQTARTNSIAQRVITALMLLEKRSELINREYSDEVAMWADAGEVGKAPKRPQLPMNKLFELFTEIFPQIKLNIDYKQKRFYCVKNASAPYSITGLSDGEKQILSLLADIAVLSEPKGIIIVDEPELNLNALLAVQFWDALENELPGTTFVYATHNISFCLRDNVSKLYVLDESTKGITAVEGIQDIDAAQLQTFLGTVPAILSASKAIVTEGKPDSFDSVFYRWIVNDRKVQIVPVNGCADVLAIATKQGVWKVLAPAVQLKGIIDRDYKSDETLTSLQSTETIILDLHEVESYLCLPKIVVNVAAALGLADNIPTEDEVAAIIEKELQENKLKILARRVSQRTHLKLEISLVRSKLNIIKNEGELEQELIKEAKDQSQYAAQKLDPSEISKIFQVENDQIDKIIQSKDVVRMLSLCPGKSILDKLFKLTGAKSQMDYARACTKHINIEEHQLLKNLRDSLF